MESPARDQGTDDLLGVANAIAPHIPTLSPDVITVILGYVQRFECNESLLPTPTRIRQLLARGLVSRAWRCATTDPTLWIDFIDAAMRYDQFSQVMARSGCLPIEVNFRASHELAIDTAIFLQSTHCPSAPHFAEGFHPGPLNKLEYVVDDSSTSQLTDRKADLIAQQMNRVTALRLDLSHATDVDREGLRRILLSPAPNIHTVALILKQASYMDFTIGRGRLFGGKAPFIRCLQLTGCHILPPLRCNHLITLTLGFGDFATGRRRLREWANFISSGAMPVLETLILHGVQISRSVTLESPVRRTGVPRILRRFDVTGQALACAYLLYTTILPAETDFRLKIEPYIPDKAVIRCLMNNIRSLLPGSVPTDEILLQVTERQLIMKVTTHERSITLEFVASTDFERGSMILQVLDVINSTEAILRGIHGGTWLTLDLTMFEEDFMGQTDPYGFQQPSMRDYLPAVRRFLQLLQGVTNLRIVRYEVHPEGRGGIESWADPIGIYRASAESGGGGILVPELRRSDGTGSTDCRIVQQAGDDLAS